MEIDQSINQSVIWHGLNSNKIEPTWTRYAESFQVQEDSIYTYTLGNLYVCMFIGRSRATYDSSEAGKR